MSKKHAQQVHFMKRCILRIGYELNYSELIKKIQNNELEFYDRQSNRISRWNYRHQGKDFLLVYDKTRKTLVTVYEKGLADLTSNFDYKEGQVLLDGTKILAIRDGWAMVRKPNDKFPHCVELRKLKEKHEKSSNS